MDWMAFLTGAGSITALGGAIYGLYINLLRSRVRIHTEVDSFGALLVVRNDGETTALVRKISVLDVDLDRIGLNAGNKPGPEPWIPGEPYPTDWKIALEPSVEVLPGATGRYSFLFGTFRSDRSSCRISVQIDERRRMQLFKSRTITVMQASVTAIDTGK